jgi:glycosyltransferase involved in cell wall biosynthesis
MKLMLVTPFGTRAGGSDEALVTLLRNLDRRRFEPLVVTLDQGRFVDELERLEIPVVALPGGRLRNPRHVLRTFRRLRHLIERERPHLIVSWLSTAHLYVGPAAWAAGRTESCLWWQHDLHGARAGTGDRLRDRLGTYRGQLLDAAATMVPARGIGCVSEAVRVEQTGRWPHRETFVTLNGIDEPVRAGGESVTKLRSDLRIPQEALVVGIVGRLFAWKGHQHLLRALAELRGRGHGIFGLFVGGGGERPNREYEAYLARLTGELGLSDYVRFTGQVPSSIPYMQVMDLLVNASTPEPFGLVIVEAMALELPVVAVDAGGPAEIIADGESGILVPSAEPGALSGAIESLIADPALRRSLGTAGRRRYLDRFTGERMARDVERCLEAVA